MHILLWFVEPVILIDILLHFSLSVGMLCECCLSFDTVKNCSIFLYLLALVLFVCDILCILADESVSCFLTIASCFKILPVVK